MRIRGLLSGDVIEARPDEVLRTAARRMIENDVGSLAVIGDGVLRGILTERDLLRAAAEGVDPGVASVAEWMTVDPDTVDPEFEVEEAADWMLATGYRHLPVEDDDGLLIGVASIKDVLWALREMAPRAVADTADM